MIERYTLPEMGVLWTDDARYARWLRVELAACEVLAEDGEIPAEAMKEIRDGASFDSREIDAIEAETRHDVIAFLTCVQRRVGEAGRHIHRGMTSSDVVDTALSMAMGEALELIGVELRRLSRAVAAHARKHGRTAMMGRTHGVHAEPTTFGVKLCVWYRELLRHAERLEAARRVISVGKLSGAVGLYPTLSPAVEQRVMARLGLQPALAATQVLQRDRHAEVLSALALLSTSLEKFSIELRHLARTEVREVEEPFAQGQKGSSAMPHKKNPILCERVTGLSRLVRSHAFAALENVPLWHERDISHSSAERVLIPDAFITLHYQLRLFTEVIEGLKVFPERMRANIESTGGIVFSGRVLTALTAAGMARETAYELVQTHALAAWEQGGATFRQRLASEPEVERVLGPDRLEHCFDLVESLRHADTIVERSLAGEAGGT